MTREQVKDLIVEKASNGIKGVTLAFDHEIVLACEDFEVPDLFNELVNEKRLVEIEYVLPDMDYRCKSFYLPAGTKVRVINGKAE